MGFPDREAPLAPAWADEYGAGFVPGVFADWYVPNTEKRMRPAPWFALADAPFAWVMKPARTEEEALEHIAVLRLTGASDVYAVVDGRELRYAFTHRGHPRIVGSLPYRATLLNWVSGVYEP